MKNNSQVKFMSQSKSQISHKISTSHPTSPDNKGNTNTTINEVIPTSPQKALFTFNKNNQEARLPDLELEFKAYLQSVD